MALDEYRAKRDFTRSPEPRGDRVKKSRKTSLFFCVQKHLASSLHYDFRLEWDGVLLSWAVPKGPSLDPSVKRLAMHVEDHPLEYGEFEGVIPDGYGAGVVLLWDRGTWTPESDDVAAALKKGDFKFRLDGYKLKGSWALIRTRGYGAHRGGDSSRSWLLIKHRDEWAGDLDITEFAPDSVKSGGSFGDVLTEELPGVWTSNREGKGGDTVASLTEIVKKVERYERDRVKMAGGAGPARTATRAATRAAAAPETKSPGTDTAAARRPAARKTPAKRTRRR
jgi:bifunctional non-homologous end joining protein LigD